MAAQALPCRRQLARSRRPTLHVHAAAAQVSGAAVVPPTPSSECMRSSSDGSGRKPCCHRRTPRPCSSGRCSPPARSHAQDRWLAHARHQAHRSTDRSCRVIETLKKGVLRYRTPLEKLTSGLPKGSPSRPGSCLNANRQSDSFTSLEIAMRKFQPHSGRHPSRSGRGHTSVPITRVSEKAGRRQFVRKFSRNQTDLQPWPHSKEPTTALGSGRRVRIEGDAADKVAISAQLLRARPRWYFLNSPLSCAKVQFQRTADPDSRRMEVRRHCHGPSAIAVAPPWVGAWMFAPL